MKSIWKRWKYGNASAHIEEGDKQALMNAGIPDHIAIIMDGNGRWARKRALPRVAGHREGMNTVKKITRAASGLGVKILTLYAFSTENWKRPETEVDYLMKLPVEFLDHFLPELIKENVRVEMMGDLYALPENTRKAIRKAVEDTKLNDGMILNLAFNYGSRAEILHAVKAISADVQSGELDIADIDEALFSERLMTKQMSDPDLLIRTSGEIRLSNFMLWQLAYSEFWFTDVLWPDFSEADLKEAIVEFQRRSRRFGGI